MTPHDDRPPLDAARLHQDSLVFDGHADTLLGIVDAGHHIDAAPPPPGFHVDLPRMAKGGLDAEFFTAFVAPDYLDAPRARASKLIDALHAEVASNPTRLVLCTTAAQIRAAVASGKCAAVPAIEGGHAIEDRLEHLREFRQRGVRLMTLTWNNSNGWADGCLPGPNDPHHGGLSTFGRKVIEEMERLGVLVDVSHASRETLRDVSAIASRPFVASHSGADAVTAHPRNLLDAELDAIAQSGGLVGVPFVSSFLSDEAAAWKRTMGTDEYRNLEAPTGEIFPMHARPDEEALYHARVPRSTLDDFFRHFDYIVKRIGPEHVGLGTDFDGTRRLPVGIEDVTDLPKVTEGLVKRGYEEAEIRGFLGENWLRVVAG